MPCWRAAPCDRRTTRLRARLSVFPRRRWPQVPAACCRNAPSWSWGCTMQTRRASASRRAHRAGRPDYCRAVRRAQAPHRALNRLRLRGPGVGALASGAHAGSRRRDPERACCPAPSAAGALDRDRVPADHARLRRAVPARDPRNSVQASTQPDGDGPAQLLGAGARQRVAAPARRDFHGWSRGETSRRWIRPRSRPETQASAVPRTRAQARLSPTR